MVTSEDLERYLCATHAAQSIEGIRNDFPRWCRRLADLGAGDVALALGSLSAWHVDLWANQASGEASAHTWPISTATRCRVCGHTRDNPGDEATGIA